MTEARTTQQLVEERIRDVADFPKPGVVYKDITPLLADPLAFAEVVAGLTEGFEGAAIDKVVGIEARGFILAAPVALRLGAGFVPVRKAGKLPWQVLSDTYELEYGTDTLEVHRDAVEPGERVLVVDDVLATGGTASAALRLMSALGARTVGFACALELVFLEGRHKLAGVEVHSLIRYG
jgi:adenine phosphoribosyltransferase